MSTLTELLAKHRRTAEAATPGPWGADGLGGIQMDGTRDGYIISSPEQRKIAHVYMTTTARTACHRDASHIAANSPEVVLALVKLAEETAARHPEENYPSCFWCALLRNLHAALETQP